MTVSTKNLTITYYYYTTEDNDSELYDYTWKSGLKDAGVFYPRIYDSTNPTATLVTGYTDEYEYAGYSTAAFAITQADLEISIPTNQVKTYNGEEQSILFYLYIDGKQITYDSTKAIFEYDNGTTKTTTHPKNAGSYTVKITIPEERNFKSIFDTGSLIINKATPTVTFPTLSGITQGQQASNSGGSATGVDNQTLPPRFVYDTTTIQYSGNAETYTTTVNVTYQAPNSNYTSVSKDISVTLYAVAYIGSTYYPTIQGALNASSSGTSIYVIPGLYSKYSVSIDVDDSITISNGVKLYIPFEAKNYVMTDYSSLGTSFADTDSTKVKTNRQTLINLINGADIIVDAGGYLYLGGQTHRVGVTGLYAEINLGAASMIDVSGTFYCYGYVKENSKDYKNALNNEYSDYNNNSYDTDRLIRVNSGGNLTTVIGLYTSITNLSNLLNYNNAGVFPFAKFDFANMQTYTEINYGATFDAQLFMYATYSADKIAINDIMSVVSTSGGMFSLKSGNLAFEYCPTDINYTNNTNITKIYVNGELEQGYVDLTIQGQNVTTEDKFLPLSYKLNIFINNGATYKTSYQIKMLPGAYLKVNAGGTLNVDKDMIFYEGSAKTNIEGYDNSQDAVLINNGTINITANGKLAAFIETECTDGTAKLNFSAVTSSEAFTVIATEGQSATEITRTASGEFVDGSETGKSIYQFVAGSTVTSSQNGLSLWDGEKYKLNKLNIEVVDKGYSINILEYQVFVADDSNGTNSGEISSLQYTSDSFDVPYGKYIKIAINRHAGASFGDGSAHNSNTWYNISSDINLSIIPNEGVKIEWSSTSISGAGNTSYTFTECLTSNGTFYEIGTQPANSSITVIKNAYFKIKGNMGFGTSGILKISSIDVKSGPSVTVKEKTAVQATDNFVLHFNLGTSGCVAEGTLITMADGTYKPIEEITIGEKVLVWDFIIGGYTSSKVGLLFNHGTYETTVINLKFEDGTIIKVIAEHGFFDITKNKWVYINEINYASYLGDYFVKSDNIYNNRYQSLKLVDVFITIEETGVYSLLTESTFNCFSNNMLSNTPVYGGDGIFHYFDIVEGLKYDIEKMNYDINHYGVYKYDEWKEYCDEYLFETMNMKYLKISIEKGLITKEKIIELLEMIYYYS